ncbi:3-deoxy-manno-octulosonate cytidylyltransferase [Streptomyces justiciae]|uniref:3-deoxy-manno-octulosonate cytidylyltransferase n=1 Tax=Streptomyces justiciae TaxID=2780140 RepID=UPI00188196CB|nr:3-deoxy-manno-octulosonate cytidylyltransferase [Streptomyces justiciae]MBE8477514.1 3-deoxy-manno-octulosonate cytidylyltransferase [Streptomyces justiciae]
MLRVAAVIPCRYGSTRFPGKPLAELAGMPLMWHVHQQCLKARQVAEAVVATDDERIADACVRLGIPHRMTGEHATGTDRVAECAEHLDADVIVNVQGDEPFIVPAAIDAVVSVLLGPEAPPHGGANGYAEIINPAAVIDHNVVKVVLRADGTALAFSRHPIPYPKGLQPTYLRQLGLYAFTPEALRTATRLPPGPAEKSEGIEMLRFLEHSLPVTMVRVQHEGIAIDTPEDLQRAQSRLRG